MGKYTTVGTPFRKVDSLALAMGRERFTADFPLDRPLVLKFMYSDVPHAEIVALDTAEAEKLEGVAGIFHHWNCPDTFYTTAGQGYPEPSAYDNRLFDHRVRFVGDRICMVAAETAEIADEAIARIRVTLDPLPALFDPEMARDPDAPRLHGDGEYMPIPVRYLPEENVCAGLNIPLGDVEKGMAEADFVIEHRYTTHQTSHAALEPHVVSCSLDPNDRLIIITATQVPFHARRIVGRLLGIPIQRIRVIKPRIGGGFGAKQEVLLEPYAALATLRTGRTTFVEMNRTEVFVSSRTRHPMRVDFAMGVKKSGEITALKMDALMDSGAYGTHGLTVLSNAGAKVLPLCKRYGAAVIALTIDEDGMAKTAEKKIEIAQRIFDLATKKYGMRPEDLLFDPLTFTLGSGDQEFRRAGVETLNALRGIKEKLPGVHTLLGVSNISFGLSPETRHVQRAYRGARAHR